MYGFTPPSERQASYWPGTVQDAAEAQVRDLLGALDVGDVEHYSREARRTEVYLLAGNGPTVEVAFTLADGGEVRDAVLLYSDGNGQAAVPVPEPAREPLLRELRAYGS